MEKWRKKERKKKEQESAEAISGLKSMYIPLMKIAVCLSQRLKNSVTFLHYFSHFNQLCSDQLNIH